MENDTSPSNNLNEPAVPYVNHASQRVQVKNLDDELEMYLRMVPDEDKLTLLEVVKRFAVNNPSARVSDEEWEIMERERAAFLAGTAKTYTQEEAISRLRSKIKKDDLLRPR